MDKGLILDPRNDLSLDFYPAADFTGLWGHEHPHDPDCAHSQPGFVITLAGCPVGWSSKLQTKISLSTMESEYVPMSMVCKDLFPITDLVKELGQYFDLPVKDQSQFHVRIHEDNVGALLLGQLEPRRMTPRLEHCAMQYHWFCEQIGWWAGNHFVDNIWDDSIPIHSFPRGSVVDILMWDHINRVFESWDGENLVPGPTIKYII